jgi:hypothetical protein
MLGAQMIAANAAALDLYRRAWIPEQSFEVSTRYLALAEKAARTLARLSEALDRHRGKGQQQITVKHAGGSARLRWHDRRHVVTQRAGHRPRLRTFGNRCPRVVSVLQSRIAAAFETCRGSWSSARTTVDQHRPFAIAGRWQGSPSRFRRAPQRGAAFARSRAAFQPGM